MDLKSGRWIYFELNCIVFKCPFISINTLSDWNAALVGIAASCMCCFAVFVLFQRMYDNIEKAIISW